MKSSVLDTIVDDLEIKHVQELHGTKNRVYVLSTNTQKKYILKIFKASSDTHISNKEMLMYHLLKGSKHIKKIVRFDEEYVVTEYLSGTSVDEILLSDIELKNKETNIIGDILGFITECGEISGTGVGNFNDNLLGENIPWDSYLLRYIEGIHKRNKNPEILSFLYDFLKNYIEKNRKQFLNIVPVVIPIDLNLKNFLLDSEGNVKCIDLDAAWLGDYILPYGELLMHIYGTKLYLDFVRNNAEFYIKNCTKIHFYALFTIYSLLSFLNVNSESISSIKPWGNQCNFIDLIRSHIYIIENPEIIVLRTNLLKNNSVLNSDMGVKVLSLSEHSEIPKETEKFYDIEKIVGITRIADITGLDKIGICAIQSIRPDAEYGQGSFTIFSGKGLTKEQCRISAIMEGIERYCAEERNNREIIVERTISELEKASEFIHPKELDVLNKNCSSNQPIEWMLGWDLLSGKSVYVPAANICFPYHSEEHGYNVRNYTTGLAAGNTFLEAITHGLCEVIERDAAAMNLLFKEGRSIDANSINNSSIKEVINQIKKVPGIRLHIKYISSSEIDVPVFQVILDDTDRKDPIYISGGYGAHPNKNIALLNALNEAVLSRAGTISGAREDLEKFLRAKENYDYEEYKNKYQYWFQEKECIDFECIQSSNFPTILEDLNYCVQKLTVAGFRRIIYINLSKENINIPVVKVLVPGLERYSFRMKSFGHHAIDHIKQKKGERKNE